jgi:hypothetical protein
LAEGPAGSLNTREKASRHDVAILPADEKPFFQVLAPVENLKPRPLGIPVLC